MMNLFRKTSSKSVPITGLQLPHFDEKCETNRPKYLFLQRIHRIQEGIWSTSPETTTA